MMRRTIRPVKRTPLLAIDAAVLTAPIKLRFRHRGAGPLEHRCTGKPESARSDCSAPTRPSAFELPRVSSYVFEPCDCWRWQRDWRGMYVITLENRVVNDPWRPEL